MSQTPDAADPPATPPEPPPEQPPAAPPPSAARRLMGPFGIAASLFFIAIWLLPITYVGSAGRDIRWMHRDLRHMQRVACLFTKEVGAWGTYHIEVRKAAGGPWVELPLDGFFDMSIFGYRTRFHRLIGKSYRRGGGRARSRYLAQWIAQRYASLNPGAPPLQGVRYVSASRTVATLLEEKGRFRKLPLAEMPKRRQRVLMTFEGADMRYVPKRRRSRRGARPDKRGAPARRAPTRPPLQPLPARGRDGLGQPPATPRLQPIRPPGGAAAPKSGDRPPLQPLPARPAPAEGGER